MSQEFQLKPLPFEDIEQFLESERKTILQVNGLSGDNLEYVRTVQDAKVILNFIKDIQTKLYTLFLEYPSLTTSFDKEFLPVQNFFNRGYVLDLCFLDDCLIPEKEMFFFGQDGSISKDILKAHTNSFYQWVTTTEKKHTQLQETIKNNFSLNLKSKDFECDCSYCLSTYRNKIKDYIIDQCYDLINQASQSISELIKNHDDLNSSSRIFQDMHKNIDKKLYKIRYRIKRSTLNKMEIQTKNKIKEVFTFPSELAKLQEYKIKKLFRKYLNDEEINEELLDENDLKKFFNQLGPNIWRNERYIEKEFKKTSNSIMAFKKKDISGKILQDYIGKFWIHSQARTIKRKIIYHMGPTNSGKTYSAIEELSKSKKGCYLAPLRLLAAELFDTLNQKGVPTTLLTGEEIIENKSATHYSSTIEMAKLQEYFDCCVIDEIQMITDPQRGWAWTRALINIFSHEIHICGDSSVLNLIEKIVALCDDELEIKNYERMTELKIEENHIFLKDMEKSDALIVFSRRNALRYKRDLEKLGFKVSIVYGRLSPEVRREQARKFDSQETDIMVSTDAIAMGMNLPIKRVVFSTLSKFIDSQEQPITNSEIKQIAGRSGRYKRFPTGHITCLNKCEDGIYHIKKALEIVLKQKEKCMLGPDLDIYRQVNNALEEHELTKLKLSHFLRLFNTMTFNRPFFCVELKEMIELSELVEDADNDQNLTYAEVFGFACAPVNLGLLQHVQHYIWILNHYVNDQAIYYENIDANSNDIDYLETSIKCVELYQWLSRHFNNKNFSYNEIELLNNKNDAVEKLNTLLSNKIIPTCSICSTQLDENTRFNICERCFKKKRFSSKRPYNKKQFNKGNTKKRVKKRKTIS